MGQSKVMNLLDSFCSSSRLTTAGSSSESSKSSGMVLFLTVSLFFFGGIYNYIHQIIYNDSNELKYHSTNLSSSTTLFSISSIVSM